MASAKKVVKAAKSPKTQAKSAAGKVQPKKPGPPAKAAKRGADVVKADPTLFDPLTPGEVADALRTLTEDRRVSCDGEGRPLPRARAPSRSWSSRRTGWPGTGSRASSRTTTRHDRSRRCVRRSRRRRGRAPRAHAGAADAVARRGGDRDLDRDRRQPRAREARASATCRSRRCTTGAARPATCRSRGARPRSIFGRADGHASLVAVVDLLDQPVTQVVPAEQW